MEQPSKYYLVIRGQRLVVEAESSIQMIMEKLQSYKMRVALNFEVRVFLCMLIVFCFGLSLMIVFCFKFFFLFG